MNALFLSKEESRVLHNALNTRAVDLMKQINDTWVYCDPDKAPEIREKLYDEVEKVDDLLDRLKFWEM